MAGIIDFIGKNTKRLGWAAAVCLALCACQQNEWEVQQQEIAPEDSFVLTIQSNKMLPQQVATRASDPKEEAEKRINQLYLFFFDANGQFLKEYQGRFFGYQKPSPGQSIVKIDKSAITEILKEEANKEVTIYVVANVEPEIFNDNNEDGIPDIFNETETFPLQQLQKYTYRPEDLALGLPENGMPMVGSAVIDFSDTNIQSKIIELKALMARVDVNIHLDSEVGDGNLPALNLMTWTVLKAPRQVTFSTPGENEVTTLSDSLTSEETETPYNGGTIYNRNGEISFSFYMFENIQNKNDWNDYPDGVNATAPEAQRYKPKLANKDAAAVQLHAYYSTYNDDGSGSATYDVTYTLYLGANHTDDFKVKRNHQYKNDITIKGLTQVGNNPEHITFDARVNIVEDNPFYIAILRERNHDAHFCVTPMDVYLFDGGEMTVTLGDDADIDGKPWIRMEKVASQVMASGDPQDNDHLGYPEMPYHAGTGKRKYFTKGLLDKLDKEVTLKHRDRVYFYLDENLKLEDREAVVTLTYTNGTETKTRTLTLAQTHLLPVNLRDGGVIYMEAYEEYLDHYDPLNEFLTEHIYTGLPWANAGTQLVDYEIPQLYKERDTWGFPSFNAPEDNYNDGLAYTSFIIYLMDQNQMDLNQTPLSAFQYCFNKNKRNDNGMISIEYDGTSIVDYKWEEVQNDSKWFLPGIRQMEDALTQYYTVYEEFQNNFYWSSSAGKRENKGWEIKYQQSNVHARATKVLSDGSYAESGGDEEDNYTNENGDGGRALRTQSLRIRAFRTDLEPVE